MATLGETIRARRDELGLTQEQLAERLGYGVRQSEISRLEHNRIHLPRRERLEQIAEALGLPLGELLAASGWSGAETAFPAEETSGTRAETASVALEHVLDEAKEVVAHLEELVETADAVVSDVPAPVTDREDRRASVA